MVIITYLDPHGNPNADPTFMTLVSSNATAPMPSNSTAWAHLLALTPSLMPPCPRTRPHSLSLVPSFSRTRPHVLSSNPII